MAKCVSACRGDVAETAGTEAPAFLWRGLVSFESGSSVTARSWLQSQYSGKQDFCPGASTLLCLSCPEVPESSTVLQGKWLGLIRHRIVSCIAAALMSDIEPEFHVCSSRGLRPDPFPNILQLLSHVAMPSSPPILPILSHIRETVIIQGSADSISSFGRSVHPSMVAFTLFQSIRQRTDDVHNDSLRLYGAFARAPFCVELRGVEVWDSLDATWWVPTRDEPCLTPLCPGRPLDPGDRCMVSATARLPTCLSLMAEERRV